MTAFGLGHLGRLALRARQPSDGGYPCFSQLTRDGRSLLVANYAHPQGATDYGITVLPVAAGSLGRATGHLALTGEGAGPESHAHSVIELPLLRPITGTLALFVTLSVWNDPVYPVMFLSDEEKFRVTVAVFRFLGSRTTDPPGCFRRWSWAWCR